MSRIAKNIHLLIPNEFAAGDLRSSPVASLRLRVALLEMIFKTDTNINITRGEEPLDETDVLVICKPMFSPLDGEERKRQWIGAITKCASRQIPCLLDYTDHHLGVASPYTRLYELALEKCTAVITSSNFMLQALDGYHAGAFWTIEDAVEVPLTPPKPGLVDLVPTLLWFGHSSNIKFLIDYLTPHHKALDDARLILLTDRTGASLFKAATSEMQTRLRCELFEWSPSNILAAGRISDWALIPSNPRHPAKQYVSNNRLLTSFALGLPVAASNLASYAPYEKFFKNIDNHWTIEEWSNPGSEREKILTIQGSVLPNFAPECLAQKWRSCLSYYL
jgi:hypothetical protein